MTIHETFGMAAMAAAFECSEHELRQMVLAGAVAQPWGVVGGEWRWLRETVEHEVRKRFLGYDPGEALIINQRMSEAVWMAIERAETVEALDAKT